MAWAYGRQGVYHKGLMDAIVARTQDEASTTGPLLAHGCGGMGGGAGGHWSGRWPARVGYRDGEAVWWEAVPCGAPSARAELQWGTYKLPPAVCACVHER